VRLAILQCVVVFVVVVFVVVALVLIPVSDSLVYLPLRTDTGCHSPLTVPVVIAPFRGPDSEHNIRLSVTALQSNFLLLHMYRYHTRHGVRRELRVRVV
jgi:hypothetical protein